jgi:hypothetical protein
MFQTYYDKSARLWYCYAVDNFGQVGDAKFAPTKELAIYLLGLECGINPQKFARPMEMHYAAYEKELGAV